MELCRSTTAAGRASIPAIAANPSETLIALDYDGTLAPIVDNPDFAFPSEDAMGAVQRLGALVGQLAIITGREVNTAVKMGRFADRPNLDRLIVLGQYGVERWDAATGAFHIPLPPESIQKVQAELPDVLARAGYPDAGVEHKGRAIAVHTRRLAEPAKALADLEKPILALAHRHGLAVQAGKFVWEIKPASGDKGQALRRVQEESKAKIVVYAGDDYGDVDAFNMLEHLRTRGICSVALCSASEELPTLSERADVVCEGPAGIAQWLHALADAIEASGGVRRTTGTSAAR